MLAPVVTVATPLPGIVMHGDAPARPVVIAVGCVPAITFAIAGDIGRSRHGQRGNAPAPAIVPRMNVLIFMRVSPWLGKTPPAKKNGGTCEGVPPSFGKHASRSERDPYAIAPVAAAFMIVTPVAVRIVPATMEIPVIGMEFEMHARRSNAALGMPAIAFAIAGDVGGGRKCDRNQRTCARQRRQEGQF